MDQEVVQPQSGNHFITSAIQLKLLGKDSDYSDFLQIKFDEWSSTDSVVKGKTKEAVEDQVEYK